MNFQILKTHDFKQTVLSIGGQLIGGFGEEGGIEFEWGSDIGEDVVGADGEVTFSRTNDRRLYADITVMQTSAGYARLMALMRAQQAQSNIEELPFELSNPGTGERVACAYTVFKTRSDPTQQKQAQERTIRVLLPYAEVSGPETAL
ncbi:hypothetical protein DL240_09210 [Lujinxingia litoralis]|uniref:DUF3277 domain-containing protein n=1 Tax=Lujinxingia litoralis TaxID=2211119 RepID=A0A328C8W2_9DELT|nr:phage protein [Lujinxingia litoralis]RAL23054.1 hypothetical protein DL240_09210 [Lujinxingia litoralis]